MNLHTLHDVGFGIGNSGLVKTEAALCAFALLRIPNSEFRIPAPEQGVAA